MKKHRYADKLKKASLAYQASLKSQTKIDPHVAIYRASAKESWKMIKEDLLKQAKKGFTVSHYYEQNATVADLIRKLAIKEHFKVDVESYKTHDGDDGDGRQWYDTFRITIGW